MHDNHEVYLEVTVLPNIQNASIQVNSNLHSVLLKHTVQRLE
jgi:hypothetical protein